MDIKLSTHRYLDSDNIPWECRRNISIISKFTNVYWNKNKFILTKNTFIPNELKNYFSHINNFNSDNNILNIKKGYFHFALFFSNIGHYFTDDLIPIGKMIFLNNDQNNKNINIIFLKNDDEKSEFQLLSKKNKDFLKYFTNNEIKFLKDYNCEIFFDELIIFHKYYVRKLKIWNEPTTPNYKYLKLFINKFKENCNKIVPYKITFLSRKNAKYRRIINEKELLKELEKKYDNINLVEFENLSIQQQITLMNETKLFIAPHGAGIISSFYMQPNTKCIIIHPYGYPTNCDYPVIYKTYLNALNINCVQWINDINLNKLTKKRQGYDLHKYRDCDIKINIDNFLKIL